MPNLFAVGQIAASTLAPWVVIKVIKSETVRSGMGSCNFLFVIKILTVISKNCGFVSYRFQDKRQYWSKTTFSYPLISIPPLRVLS